jgi:hypothetical protein
MRRLRLSSDVSWPHKKERGYVTLLDLEEMLRQKRQLLVFGQDRQRKNLKAESSYLKVYLGQLRQL